jgi:hypothetical protein
MKIPTDIKIIISFIAVLFLGFIPTIAIWLPDVLMAIKTAQDEKQRANAGRAD